ncbi:MAG: apolipoprotein N-acyltransferase [Polyangiales bacterium]
MTASERLRATRRRVAWIVVGNATLYASLRVERAWPLATVVLVPWIALALGPGRAAPWLAFAAVMPGFACMHPAIGRHAPVSHAVIAAAYAVALVPSAVLVRAASRRASGSFAAAVGVVWAASEIVRTVGVVPPWHRLAMAVYAQPPLVQLADVAGLAGVSLVLAVCNGAVARAALPRLDPTLPWGGSARREVTLALALTVGAYGYGVWRLSEARDTVREGPRVLVVETDVLPDTLDDATPENAMLQQAEALTRAALAGAGRVDLVQWPEAVTPRVLNAEFLRARRDDPALAEAIGAGSFGRVTPGEIAVMQAAGRGAGERLAGLAGAWGVPILLGATALVPVGARWQRRNAMYLFAPESRTPVARHDKVLPFPVYESVPWRVEAPSVAAMLARLRPAHSPPEISPGPAPATLPVGPWVVQSPICFETETSAYTRDWLPEAQRGRLVWSHGANDAWGERSDDVLHAFRFEVFRAVEGRVGIARAANAGVAGFVSPTGALHDLVGGDRAARMPAPGRPERAARRRLRALEAERASLWRLVDPSARAAREEALRDEILSLQREATARTRGAAVKGARVAAVRVDRRRPWYPRVGRWFEGALLGAWALGLAAVGARRLRRWVRRRRPHAG